MALVIYELVLQTLPGTANFIDRVFIKTYLPLPSQSL